MREVGDNLTVHCSGVLHIEAVDDVAHHGNSHPPTGHNHVVDTRGNVELGVLTLEDGILLALVLRAALRTNDMGTARAYMD